jgi:hypothetical protein
MPYASCWAALTTLSQGSWSLADWQHCGGVQQVSTRLRLQSKSVHTPEISVAAVGVACGGAAAAVYRDTMSVAPKPLAGRPYLSDLCCLPALQAL